MRAPSWWRHQMETFSALLAICVGNSPVNSRHKGQWRGPLIFTLIYAWINAWVNIGKTGDLRRQRAHSDIMVMFMHLLVSIVQATSLHVQIIFVNDPKSLIGPNTFSYNKQIHRTNTHIWSSRTLPLIEKKNYRIRHIFVIWCMTRPKIILHSPIYDWVLIFCSNFLFERSFRSFIKIQHKPIKGHDGTRWYIALRVELISQGRNDIVWPCVITVLYWYVDGIFCVILESEMLAIKILI